MDYRIRQMKLRDYPPAYALWQASAGVYLDEEGDSRPGLARYLRRNPGLCFVACAGKRVVGTILCGHDGRRGWLRHLAVRKPYRGWGIARALVGASLSALAQEGIARCDAYVLKTNAKGLRFWRRLGWSIHADVAHLMHTRTAPRRAPK